MSTAMAATTICTHTFLCSSSTQRKSTHFTFSSSALLCPQTPKSRLSSLVPQLGLGLFSPWNGLKHLGISIKQKYVNIERRGRCKGKVVYASLFGVGAPEALVIGVVALLVFGPKGLAEVARNLGKTLRSFQPTIRELQEVSKEFKNTLEREIGLDDIPSSGQNTSISSTTATSSSPDNEKSQATLDPNGTSPKATPYTSEEYLKITEEQLKTYDAQQKAPHQEEQSEGQPPLQDDAPPTTKPPSIGEFLVEAQRKSMAPQQQEQSVPQEAQSQPQSQPQEVAEEQSQSQPQPQGPQTTVSEVAPTTPQPMHESEI